MELQRKYTINTGHFKGTEAQYDVVLRHMEVMAKKVRYCKCWDEGNDPVFELRRTPGDVSHFDVWVSERTSVGAGTNLTIMADLRGAFWDRANRILRGEVLSDAQDQRAETENSME